MTGSRLQHVLECFISLKPIVAESDVFQPIRNNLTQTGSAISMIKTQGCGLAFSMSFESFQQNPDMFCKPSALRQQHRFSNR